MAEANLPSGRRGNYSCPFCDVTATVESDMISHRKDGKCAEENRTRQQGIVGIAEEIIQAAENGHSSAGD